MILRLVASVCFVFFIATAAQAEWHEWRSKHLLDHPLIGKIYAPEDNTAIDTSVEMQSQLLQNVLDRVARSKYLLLGENHANPDHHILQAKMIEAVAKTGRKPAVVFEMIPQSLSAEANAYDLKNDPELEDFAKRLAWQNRGWYSWNIYKPVGLAVARNGLKFVAGNLDRQIVRSLYSSVAALSEKEQKRYALNEPLPPRFQISLNEELIGSHCGMIGEKALPAMTRIQRAKDGAMADAVMSEGEASGAILIAGNGHTRNDRGVPWVMGKKLSKTIDVYSIGLIEVQKDISDPKQYGLINAEGEALYDVVIFTPKADITDQCAAMRKQFKTKKKSSND